MPEQFAEFHFIRPLWLLALPACIWLLYRFAVFQKSSSGWSSAIDPELLQVQLGAGGENRRRGLSALLALGLFLTVIALAGPAWQRLPQPVEERRDPLVIVLDLSLSMYAKDISPSRLVRARQKIADILRARTEGFTALVAYAGDAHAVAPLTDDTRTIENLASALSPAMMPALGSRPDTGLEIALELLENAGMPAGRILLVTDGVDSIGDVTRYSNPQIPISIIGVGTAGGASIPLDFVNQPGRVLQDEEGDVVIAKLDARRLAELAELTHGSYSTLTLDDADIATTLPPPAQDEEATLSDRRFDAWADIGPWLVLPLLPLLLLAFRRGALAVVCVAFVVPDAHAGLWDDLWQRRDQQAHNALRHGAPEAAAVLFENADWKAAAQYRSGEFDRAGAHFAGDDSVTGYYNLGNALAQTGQLDAAIAAYDKALELQPDHEDAAFNKALIEQAQDQQQGESSDNDNQESQENSNEDSDQERQQQSESDGSNEQQQNSEDPSQGDAQEGEQQQQDEQQASEPQDDSEEGEEEQRVAEQATDEQKAAMEQWLRRVPDDPGGLLRRKFKYETDKRRRMGDYQPRQKKIW